MKRKTICKKMLLGFCSLLLFPFPTYALHEMHCSNADGTLKREEQEVWGANLVSWSISGKKVRDFIEEFDEDEKVILHKTQSEDGKVEVFATRVTLEGIENVFGREDFDGVVSDYVICRAWENGARD